MQESEIQVRKERGNLHTVLQAAVSGFKICRIFTVRVVKGVCDANGDHMLWGTAELQCSVRRS